VLIEKNVIAYIHGNNVNILKTKRSKLERLGAFGTVCVHDQLTSYGEAIGDLRIAECCREEIEELLQHL